MSLSLRDDSSYIRTYTGRKFYPLDPRPEEVDIVDIAHALSLSNRYTGHVYKPYSVAQHSQIVALHCSPENALWGLLHDASEAYIADIARPVKRQPEFKFYRDAEKKIMEAVCLRYDLPLLMPEEVHVMDNRVLVTEMRDCGPFYEEFEDWTARRKVKPLPVRIIPESPENAERNFMEYFHYIREVEDYKSV